MYKAKELIIESTNICNAHCVFCPREKIKLPPTIMRMELFSKALDEGAKHGVEFVDCCAFGEFMCDPLIFERLALIKEKLPTARNYISTTGGLMDEPWWGHLLNYIDTIRFSIYGTTKDVYEKVHRGTVNFERAMKNITGFLGSLNGKRPHTIGTFCVVPQNKHQLQDWLDRWEPLFDEVMVWKPHNWIDTLKYRKVDHTKQVTCGRPLNAPMFIHVDGKVSPCCFDFNCEMVMGDINTQTMDEIWNGDPYRKIREAHTNNQFEDYICKNCDQTNHDPSVLIYSSNRDRKVGQIIDSMTSVI